jgi:hypothetical protein
MKKVSSVTNQLTNDEKSVICHKSTNDENALAEHLSSTKKGVICHKSASNESALLAEHLIVKRDSHC